MKVKIVHEISDDQRKSLAQSLGRPGLAKRDDIVRHIGEAVDANLDGLVEDFPPRRRPRKTSDTAQQDEPAL